jgi:folate-binding protein YgfZ
MAYNLSNQLTVIHVHGEDASKFLQGQLTNDINKYNDTQSQLSAHLNNKGRIIANFIILSTQKNDYFLITPKNIEAIILPRLKMFVLRSKVTIEVSDLIPVLDSNHTQDKAAFKIGNQYLMLTDDATKLELTNDSEWHKLLVDNNLPFIYLETSQQIIPQQVNLELMGGVNFQKGCYTGQEIVARTHYLGKVKRRLVKFTSSTKPEIGQTITSPTIDNQEIGFVVDYFQESNNYHGLASLQLDYIADAQLSNQKIECTQIAQDEANA